MLVGAAGVMSLGAALGMLAPSLRDAPWSDDPQQLAAAIAGNPVAWRWANGLFLAAAMLTAFGLIPLALRFPGRSRAWAWMGAQAFTFAAVFEAVDRILSIQVFSLAGQPGFDLSKITVQAFIRFDSGLGFAFAVMGFLAIGLFGIALTRVERGGSLGRILLVVAGLGLVLQAFGGTIPAMVFLGTAGLGAATWILDLPPMGG